MINSFFQHSIQIQLQEFPYTKDSFEDIGSVQIQRLLLLFGINLWGFVARATSFLSITINQTNFHNYFTFSSCLFIGRVFSNKLRGK
jgi:hypothetical protein